MNEGRISILTKLGKFMVVGGTGVLVNTVVLFLLYQVARLPLVPASIAAVETAIINNFVWNNLWTFQERSFSASRFASFNVVSLGGLVISTGTLYLLNEWAGVYYLLANLGGIALATTWNFGLSFVWTWGRS
ncbi:MAG: GtrA family protein [Candidatus Marsarchaeota archaeon]|nr:GtrA family protein [Candidatus Marsarchaeota archaeon]